MDNVDRFYLETVSGAVAGLFEPKGYDPVLIDSDDRKYVDPIAFETYLRTLPSQLWAPEFHSAYATIQGYIERNNDQGNQDFIEALVMAANSIRTLAETYSPEIAQELEAQQPVTNIPKRVTNEVTKCIDAVSPKLPTGIKDTPEARAAFDSLVEAGYLDQDYKPTKLGKKGKPNGAIYSYIAHILSTRFYISATQKIFGSFFDVPNIAQSLRQVSIAKNKALYVTEIDAALAKDRKKKL